MSTSKKSKGFRGEIDRSKYFRFPLTLPESMDTWLHDLGTQMRAQGGLKMPKSYILRSVIKALMRLDIDISDVKTEEEIEERILMAMDKLK